MKKTSTQYSLISILVIILICSYSVFNTKYWKSQERVINWDVISYYAYLPAFFVHHDIKLSFLEDAKEDYSRKFWPETIDGNKKVIKTSMGQAILYSPFFLTAHAYCKITGTEADGFSEPYRFMLKMSTLIFLFLGIFYLRKLLLRYFTEQTTAITLLLVVLGTNLFHYATFELPMTHAYNFCLFILFLYHSIEWHQNITIKRSIVLGLLSGLIVLVRPTNILILFIFLLWDVKSLKELPLRAKLLLKNYPQLLFMAITAFAVWIPQLIYWKTVTGQWLFFSYVGERFYFDQPHIIDGLFSFRKGWFVYTPIMLFAMLGLFFMRKKLASLQLPLIIFKVLNIYIILSWWCWWYGGGFGLRAFIDAYSLLAFPLAIVIEYSISARKKITRILSIVGITILLAHGIFQNFQYHYGSIHWDSMTKEAYLDSFGRLYPSKDFYELIKAPDYDNARKGLKEKR